MSQPPRAFQSPASASLASLYPVSTPVPPGQLHNPSAQPSTPASEEQNSELSQALSVVVDDLLLALGVEDASAPYTRILTNNVAEYQMTKLLSFNVKKKLLKKTRDEVTFSQLYSSLKDQKYVYFAVPSFRNDAVSCHTIVWITVLSAAWPPWTPFCISSAKFSRTRR